MSTAGAKTSGWTSLYPTGEGWWRWWREQHCRAHLQRFVNLSIIIAANGFLQVRKSAVTGHYTHARTLFHPDCVEGLAA
jgi:hypothetical protein